VNFVLVHFDSGASIPGHYSDLLFPELAKSGEETGSQLYGRVNLAK
jgi:hypothetical protein